MVIALWVIAYILSTFVARYIGEKYLLKYFKGDIGLVLGLAYTWILSLPLHFAILTIAEIILFFIDIYDGAYNWLISKVERKTNEVN